MTKLSNTLIKPVYAKKGEVQLSFDNVSQCAREFRLPSSYIRRFVTEGTTWKGYSFRAVDPENEPRNAKYFKPVVGVSPTGYAVRFKDVLEVSKTFSTHNSTIIKALSGRYRTLYGWKFIYADEYEGTSFVPMSRELLDTFRPGIIGEYGSSRGKEKTEEEQDADVDIHKGMTPIMTGYFDTTSVITVCPVCGMAVCNNYQKGRKHLNVCLKDYNFDIKHSIIRVWSRKN